MPDPRKVLSIVQRAASLMRATPGRRGSIDHVADATDMLVVGDLHGHLSTFRQALKIAALDAHPRRHLVLQELVHGPFSYPDDRGDRSHQLVDVVCALKCQYPDRVHLILGNHELAEITGRTIGKNGLVLNAHFRQGVGTAYGSLAAEIYAAYLDLFSSLPLMVRTSNRVLACHTIPDAKYLETLDLTVLDSRTWPPESLVRGGTVYALTWGRDTSTETVDRFAALMDVDLFITGHQPCDEGFRQANHRQLIVDATDPYPACCLFDAERPVTIEGLVAGVRMVPMEVS